jgi:hypothetical protein
VSPILALDLAAKFSAGCVVDSTSGDVTDQWHSWGLSPFQFANKVSSAFFMLSASPDAVLIIEDLPFAIGQTKTVRDVYRLQGMIIELVQEYTSPSRVVFIPPMLWQHYFKPDGMKPGDKKAAKLIAEEKYGYTAPQLLHKDLHGTDRAHARKTMEDYVDAFLISQYMVEVSRAHGSVAQAIEAIPRLERYSHG